MNVSIAQVTGDHDIDAVVKLANRIWRQHFTPIIGSAQVEYMLDRFQSVPAISSQLAAGAGYYIASLDARPVGYTCLIPDRSTARMMISKIYVMLEARGIGVGRRLLDFIESECATQKLDTLWLTVNRYNIGPIEWYRRHGFRIVDEVRKDIGSGYCMDDYIMEKQLE